MKAASSRNAQTAVLLDPNFGVEAAHDGRCAEAERTVSETERLRASQYLEPRSQVDGPIIRDYYGNDPEVEALIGKVRRCGARSLAVAWCITAP